MTYQEIQSSGGKIYLTEVQEKYHPLIFISKEKLNNRELDTLFEKGKGIIGTVEIELESGEKTKQVYIINTNKQWDDNEG